jgi:hypothetical protein
LIDAQFLAHYEVIFAGKNDRAQHLLVGVENVHAELDRASARRRTLHLTPSSLPLGVCRGNLSVNLRLCQDENSMKLRFVVTFRRQNRSGTQEKILSDWPALEF